MPEIANLSRQADCVREFWTSGESHQEHSVGPLERESLKSGGSSVFGESMARFRAMHRVIFHLDMDALYASVEQRDRPTLRCKTMTTMDDLASEPVRRPLNRRR